MCLTADTCLSADPGVMSVIPARSHTFVEIDHEIFFTAILLPSADPKSVVVSYKRKYVHKVLVNCLVKKGNKNRYDSELPYQRPDLIEVIEYILVFIEV